MAQQLSSPNFETGKRRYPSRDCEHDDDEHSPLCRSFPTESEGSHRRQTTSSASITSWRGLVPCLVIFLVTGLLIFSNRVQLKEASLCLKPGGTPTSAMSVGLDGDIVPSEPPSHPGVSHDSIKPHFRFPVPGLKPKLESRYPDPLPQQETATGTSSASSPAKTVLQNYEVAQPVLLPYGASDSDGSTDDDGNLSRGECKQLLMRRDFAWSYNDPYVGDYTPPNCEFNRVVINFTVVSHGRQYDRLAIMYLGDTEVWRTSTAEPTSPPGIRWVYLKDMTQYLAFWKQPQKLIFDLGNLINEKYTGIFNTTLTATFFMSEVPTDTATPSDLIIPISARQSSNSSKWVSQFTVPAQEATNTIDNFPRNARRAVFSVSANGQALEEFWWSNVPQSDIFTFNATAGELTGYSPFREVQVLIDGHLAGVQWPFPVIFTGGVSPGLHRPIASPDAYDLKEHEIDITPFLPLLSDGKPHTFSILIAGLDDDGKGKAELIDPVNESWYVTGKIFIWLDDDPNSITTGSPPTIQSLPPSVSVMRSLTTTSNGTNSSLTYTTTARRSLLISSTVKTQTSTDTFSWSQTLSYINEGQVSAFGFNQLNDLTISGTDSAKGFDISYTSDYSYPLFANSTYTVLKPAGNLTIFGRVVQSKHVTVSGKGNVFPAGLEAFNLPGRKYTGSVLSTTKSGEAWFFQTGDGMNSSGFGDAYQTFRFGGFSERGMLGDSESVELYWRNISAVNASVVYDVKRLAGSEPEGYGYVGGGGRGMGLFGEVPKGEGRGGVGLRAFMGRNENEGGER